MTTARSFFSELEDATRDEREELFRIPFVVDILAGRLDTDDYLAFLTQAYHHVKHTVPLLMATGAALPPRHAWLLDAVADYVAEERGHDAWILDDIAACGGDADAVRAGRPDLPCELMVAYAYDLVHRGRPLGFFGMVHVLEGTSQRGATSAARELQERTGLPPNAFTYLTTHGELDQDHVRFFERLMDRIDDEEERRLVVHSSRVFFHLYGNIFRGLPSASANGAPIKETHHVH